MTTVTEHIRNRLYERLAYPADKALTKDYHNLRNTEWSQEFEQYMRDRLVLGALRYGKLGTPGKPQYDRTADIKRRLQRYTQTGNDELLVDIANLALCEFVEGKHPRKHFHAVDDGEHTGVLAQ